MPRQSRNKRQTQRKGRAVSGTMTVEGLHAAFERVDKKIRAMIARGATDSELAACIKHAWSAQFHTAVSAPALKGMVGHYRAVYGGKVRKTRKAQRGGMAPLDMTMGQGVTASVYGRFPVEMGTYSGAMNRLDRFFESPISRSCDSTGGAPAPAQRGGGLFDALGMGQPPSSVPVNAAQAVISTGQGHPVLNPPREPAVSALQMATFTPQPFPISSHTISSLAPIYPAAA